MAVADDSGAGMPQTQSGPALRAARLCIAIMADRGVAGRRSACEVQLRGVSGAQREAAVLPRVSVAYLRGSTRPKVLLPGGGAKGRRLVRYLRSDVLAQVSTAAEPLLPSG